jgi:hypothetical protein
LAVGTSQSRTSKCINVNAAPNESIAILILKPEAYGALMPWTRWKEEKAWSEMVVPYVEAVYPGPLPLCLVSEIISVEITEDPH